MYDIFVDYDSTCEIPIQKSYYLNMHSFQAEMDKNISAEYPQNITSLTFSLTKKYNPLVKRFLQMQMNLFMTKMEENGKPWIMVIPYFPIWFLGGISCICLFLEELHFWVSGTNFWATQTVWQFKNVTVVLFNSWICGVIVCTLRENMN